MCKCRNKKKEEEEEDFCDEWNESLRQVLLLNDNSDPDLVPGYYTIQLAVPHSFYKTHNLSERHKLYLSVESQNQVRINTYPCPWYVDGTNLQTRSGLQLTFPWEGDAHVRAQLEPLPAAETTARTYLRMDGTIQYGQSFLSLDHNQSVYLHSERDQPDVLGFIFEPCHV